MTSAAPLLRALAGESPERRARAEATEYLGPARVIERRAGAVTVEIAGQRHDATMALAFPYEPAEGDVLLVIGRGGDHYVIGVLSGHGRTVLEMDGDVAIRARGGAVSIAGDEGVSIAAPEVAIDARTFRATAEAWVTRAGSLVQRVAKLWSLRAGESETVVDGAQVTRAKSSSLLTEGSVTINGKQIHLG